MEFSEPITILPPSMIPENSQCQLMYMPIYMIPGDSNYYSAGPLILPNSINEKGIIESFGESFTLLGKKVSKTVGPVAIEVNKEFEATTKSVNEVITPIAQNINEKIQRATKAVSDSFNNLI